MNIQKTITVLLLALSCSLFAQGHQGKRDKIKSLKVAYLTTELSLTPAEAEKFWPIYNAYDDKQFELRSKKMHPMRGKHHDAMETLDDKQALTILNQMESAEDEMCQNRKKLTADLKKVMSPVKIVKLMKAEEDFHRSMLRQYRDNHHDNHPDRSDRSERHEFSN